jgi:hypothetical protein
MLSRLPQVRKDALEEAATIADILMEDEIAQAIRNLSDKTP